MLSAEERAVLEHLRLAREGMSDLAAPKGPIPVGDTDLIAGQDAIRAAERAIMSRSGRRDVDNKAQADHLTAEVARLEDLVKDKGKR